MVNKTTSLEEYIDSFIEDSNLQEVVRSISTACKIISNSVRLAGINDLLGKTGDINVQHREKINSKNPLVASAQARFSH